jgi:hypothetical protein
MSEIPEMKTDTWGDSVEWDSIDDWGNSENENDSNWGVIPSLGDTFIVLFTDDKKFLGSVHDVDNQEGKYFTLKNNNKSLLFETEDGGIIKMKTDDYEILDIQKIKKYDMKLLELPEILEENIQDNSEIAYSLVQEKDRVYSKQELKEILISTLYSQYNKDSETKSMKEIIDYADILLDISGEEVQKKRIFDKWYIPIITNETKIISEDNDVTQELKDLIDNDMLITDTNTKNDKNYVGIMKNLLHLWDNIIHDDSNDGLTIDDYDGKVYRNCLNMNNCLGINGLYSFDEIKNNSSLKIPTNFDRITGDSNFMELRKPMKINVMGILTIPHHYFPFISDNLLNTNALTLYEKCILQELVKQTNIHKRNEFKKNDIITKELKKEHYDLNTFTIHKINSKDKDELLDDINNIKPSVKNILMSLDDDVLKKMKNYQDIAKLLINYEINYSDLDKDFSYINDILKNNTKISPKIYKLKYKKIVKRELTIEKRISLSKDIIFSMLNITSRNTLIKRFIDTFCVNSSEEPEWYIGIHDKKRLLCKHYSYLSGDKGTEEFFMMKQKYQRLPPDDGNIYCKNCGEFICKEEFSHDDGFSDDLPTSTKEILIQDKDLFEKYDESDMNNIGLLKNISQGLGVEMKDEDIVTIIDIHLSLSEDIVANKRYNMLNITMGDEHPRMLDIKKKYKKDKKLLAKSLKSFQIFLKVTNRIISMISLSLLIIATSIPIYNNKYIKDFKLFKGDNTINKDFLGKIALVLKKISYTFGEKYEKIYDELYNEKKSYDVVNIEAQIENLIKFFLGSSFPKLILRFKDYLRFKENVENKYINCEWPIYKPLSNNKLIRQINKSVNDNSISNKDLLLKTYNIVNIENIAEVSGIDSYDNHKSLGIQKNSLINTAFQRLFNLSVSLYGKLEKPNFYLDTNIEKFFNESNDEIKDICIKSGWNNKTKTMGPISFKELRNKFIPKIMNTFYDKMNNDLQPCFTLKEACNDFIHININNYDLSMINVNPKRFYKHSIPVIFPEVNFNIMSDKIKEKIFKTFAFDPSNNIVKRGFSQNYLGKFLLDISNYSSINLEDNSGFLEKDIPKNEKNFHKIIDFCHNKSRLSSTYINLPINITSDILKSSINITHINEYFSLLENKDYDFNIERFINILENIEDGIVSLKEIQKDLTEIYIEIEDKNSDLLISIGSFTKNYLDNNKLCKENFQNIFIPDRKSHIKILDEMRVKLESLGKINYRNLTDKNIEDIFRLLIEDNVFDYEYIKDVSNEILYILSNIINNGYKNSYISKYWRISDVNKEWYKKYIDTHYFSHHKDIYKKSGSKDFTEYFDKAKDHFINLYEKIKNVTNNVNIQRNITKSLTHNVKSLWRYVYLNIIKELLVFSDNLRYELDVNDIDEDSADILEKFSLDMITHLLEKKYDTTWVYSNKENLSELLGVQKEREKQNLIHKLDGMSNDKRHASTELHSIGTKNHFKASEKENMEHIEEEGYKNELDDLSYINVLMNGQTLNETQYVIEDDLSNDNYDTGEQIEDDGGNMD